ncbi:cytochrome c3 family protein [Sphingomonas antarctica]|uniref:cytochrome c3 family protein n=1 Tax=Sphingomonas antarctica TaxID=2040274 RepID=UPI0039ED01F2
MSFILRTIARTADGRDIVRSAPIDDSRLTIGRDASNRVHLPDLAVDPFHATLIRQGASVVAESSSGLGFGVDGRATTHAVLNPAHGSELRFGSHVLTLSEEDGTPVVTVAKVGSVAEARADEDGTAFSLRGKLPGKRISAWGFVLLILAACLAWPIVTFAKWEGAKARPEAVYADKQWNAGPLSTAHHGLEKDCQSCHAKPFEPVQDAKCIACHTSVHDHADPKRQVAAMAPPGGFARFQNGVKHSFGYPTGQRCVDCHQEHQGAGPMAATAQNFCTDCHATMKDRLPDTKLANAGDFATDHPNLRPTVSMGWQGDRVMLARLTDASAKREDNGLKFPHALHMSTTNGVARMAISTDGKALECASCHHKSDDGVSFGKVEMELDCQGCHSLAFERIGGTVRTLRHGDPALVVADLRAWGGSGAPIAGTIAGRRVPGFAGSAGGYGPSYGRGVDAPFVKGGACFDCHVIDRTGSSSTNGWHIRPVFQPSRYLKNGWFDHKAHATETCVTCHAGAKASNDANALLIPALDKGVNGKGCRDCHGGENSHAAVPSTCALCHSYHAGPAQPWRPIAGRRDRPAMRRAGAALQR